MQCYRRIYISFVIPALPVMLKMMFEYFAHVSDLVRLNYVRYFQCRAGQGRAGQGRAGQGRAGQGRAGQGRAGQGRAGQGRAGQGSKLRRLHGISYQCF